ncbi:MAG: VWA domain-containing protein [Planctomycetes bacterium]|nr:VWA domain-containing protein [Planctomycetota bacterium]
MRALSTTAGVALLVVLAGSSLAAAKGSPAKALVKAAKKRDTSGMVAAAEAIADKPDKAGLKALIQIGTAIENMDVYTACQNAIGRVFSDASLRGEFAKQLKGAKRPASRVLCIDGLGTTDNKDAVSLIAPFLADKNKSVRISSIQALLKLQVKESVPPLFERLSTVGFESKDAEAEELFGALFKLSKQSFEVLADWKNWWETSKGTLDPKKLRHSGSDGGTRQRNKNEGKIFESVVRSQAFVLVLDISSSMRVIDLPMGETWYDKKKKKDLKYKDPDPKGTKSPHKNSRFRRAQDAFCKFIEGMSGRARFAIVVFGDKKDTKLWKKDVVPATKSNKKAAVDFVRKLKWSPATRTDLALERAFSVKGADTIYFFSDGIPEKIKGGKTVDIPQDEVIEKARLLNRTRKLRLNCYGMTSSNKTRSFLEKLAKENGGEYKDIRVRKK